jgi:hypothetical protein
MAEDDPGGEPFIENFRKELSQTSEFIQVVLNGHFDVERHLDEFVDQIFYHPGYLEKARLTFFQKVHVAQAYTELSHDRPEWRLMLELNALRNKIAHRSTRRRTMFSTSQLTRIMDEVSTEKAKTERLGISASDVVVFAALTCSGYLVVLTDQLKKAQGFDVEEDD